MKFLKQFRILTDSSHRWKIYLLTGILLYFFIINQFIMLRPDHVFLMLLLLMFTLGKDKAKRFITDWLPFVGFWIAYDMMRGVVDNLQGYIHVREVYNAEFALFGKIFPNVIPAFWFQQVQYIYDSQIWKKVLDVIAANVYSFHFFGPMILGWILWHTVNDRRMFYRFVWTLTVLNVMALTTYFLYPAAPPWYVMRFGFDQPAGPMLGSAGALINLDRMLNINFFSTIWDKMNPNQFAAIPSLHGSYPIVISIFAFIRFRKYLIVLILYPIFTWWATVYLNHHYIVDLMIGASYAGIAYFIANKILIPRVFDPLLFKDRKSAS